MQSIPRRSQRVECVLHVSWRSHRADRSGVVLCCNLHGMFVATDHRADVGYLMDVTVETPSGPISCTAVPRFVGESPSGHGIGLELHVMDAADRARWQEHYRRALRDARDAGVRG